MTLGSNFCLHRASIVILYLIQFVLWVLCCELFREEKRAGEPSDLMEMNLKNFTEQEEHEDEEDI